MLSKAWLDGNKKFQRNEIVSNKLKDFALYLAHQYLEKGKEKIQEDLKEMGSKSVTRNVIKYYVCYNNHNRYKNLKTELTFYDPSFEYYYTWNDILSSLENEIIISLEEITHDRDYRNIYIKFYRTQWFFPEKNVDSYFNQHTNFSESFIDVIVCDLVIQNNACNIL